MSRIDELVQRLCPDGVEWKTLGEIGKVCMCKRIFKEQTAAVGEIPFYKIGTFGKEADAYISKELYQEYKKRFSFPKNGDILISASGTIGRTVVYNGEPAYFQDSNIVWIDNDESFVTNEFLFHYYQIVKWQTDTGGTIVRLYNDNLKKTKIPVPPLEIQNEIVRTLDLFNELDNQLEAELEARKIQYSFYRDALLSFEGKDVEWKTLGECLERNIGGGTPSKAKSEYWNGDIPWASVGDLTVQGNLIQKVRNFITKEGLKNSSSNLIKKGCVIVAVKISPGKMKIADIDIAINQDLRGLYLKAFLNSKFLVYYFQTFSINGNGTIVKGITVETLEKVKLPIPPLSEQEKIVTILDKFDALINDISIGLPAEIEARRKQYEYYRNTLLTFKNVSNG